MFGEVFEKKRESMASVSSTTSSNYSMEIKTKSSFKDYFWGDKDKGFDILLNQLSNGKKTTLALQAFILQKIKIEEEYASKMLKLSKISIHDDDYEYTYDYTDSVLRLYNSSFKQSMQNILIQTEKIAKTHMKLALNLSNYVQQPLFKFVDNQQAIKRKHKCIVLKNLKAKHYQLSILNKAQKKYYKVNIAKENLEKTSTDDQLEKKMEKKSKWLTEQAQLYDQKCKNLAIKLSRIQEAWKESMLKAADEFQNIEIERILLTEILIMKLSDFSAQTGAQDVQSYQDMRLSFDCMDINADFKKFCKEKGTGREIPECPTYLSFDNLSSKKAATTATMTYNHTHLKAGAINDISTTKTAAVLLNNEKATPEYLQYLDERRHSNSDRSSLWTDEHKSCLNLKNVLNGVRDEESDTKDQHQQYKFPTIQEDAPSYVSGKNTLCLFKVKTLYLYTAQSIGELSFKKDQVIHVTSLEFDPWWVGYLSDRPDIFGVFPSNFVTKVG